MVDRKTKTQPLYSEKVPAGFPSPADDFIEKSLDLNHHLVQNPVATFFVRISGDSMKDAGILDGDIIVVDRSINARHNKIVVAAIDGELLVKRFIRKGTSIILKSENKKFKELEIKDEQDLVIWGVVTSAIHSF
jgi:DNA polymerase V